MAEALRRRLPAWALRPAPWRWLLAAMVAVVSWFAFAPVAFDDRDLPLDKVRHLAAFGALAWVAVQGFGALRQAEARIAVTLFAYGVLIEGVQSGIPAATPAWPTCWPMPWASRSGCCWRAACG